MTQGLYRYYGSNDLHFITCSCYQRRPVLSSAQRRDLLLDTLEETRQRYRFVLVGFVVMPEHLHLLITEPETGDPSVVMKVLKERFTRKLRTAGAPLIASFAMSGILRPEPAAVWQKRFYDFNVWTEKKRIEKLRPVPQVRAGFGANLGSLPAVSARTGAGPRGLASEQLPAHALRERVERGDRVGVDCKRA